MTLEKKKVCKKPSLGPGVKLPKNNHTLEVNLAWRINNKVGLGV